MTFYEDMQTITSEILDEFKQGTINLLKITSGSGPADNPGASTSTSYSLKAVARGVSLKYVKEGLAAATDLEVTASIYDGITPTVRDFVEIDSVKYKIVQIMNIPSAGTTIAWKFIVRKGS